MSSIRYSILVLLLYIGNSAFIMPYTSQENVILFSFLVVFPPLIVALLIDYLLRNKS